MPGERGALEKLMVQAFEKPDYSGKPVLEFEAFVNPTEITVSYEMEYDSAQGSGTTNSRMEFKKVKPGDLSLTFFLDGTGASGRPLDVQAKVEEFQRVTGFNGKIHRPNYLKVGWGTIEIKRCILKSASIAYKLFKPDGVPLRAVITANFTDNADDRTRVAVEQKSSPDVTHARLVTAGDDLPTLCHRIYDDPFLYLQVARANRLDDFRRLTPGTKIFFPPVEK
jgi:nucleoid-associated protein YgaU